MRTLVLPEEKDVRLRLTMDTAEDTKNLRSYIPIIERSEDLAPED